VTEPPLVVPLGRYVGLLPDGGQLRHTVRLGRKRIALSNEDMLAWATAHGRSTPDVALRRIGLLAEVGGDQEAFARGVRLLPLAIGLGNEPARPRTFAVGYPGSAVPVTAPVFHLWSRACVEPDLWTACTVLAERDRADPRRLLADLLADLHRLLAANVACLDLRLDAAS
jgi:hypothetical protein